MFALLAACAALASASPDSGARTSDTLPTPPKGNQEAGAVQKGSAKVDAPSAYERFGRWQFGISGGKSTGGGLAVRYWLDERNGLELHGYAYLSKRTFPNDDFSVFSETGGDDYYYGDDTGVVARGEVSLGLQYLHEVLKVHLFTANGLIKGPCYLRGLTHVGTGVFVSYEDRDLHNSATKHWYSYGPNGYTSGYSVTPESKLNYSSTTKKVLGGAGAGLEVELSRFSAHLLVGLGGYTQVPTTSYEIGPTVDGGVFVRF